MGYQNKIQKVSDGTNVIVEIKGGTRVHMSHLDQEVGELELLSESEVLAAFEKGVSPKERIAIAKRWLAKRDGYAITRPGPVMHPDYPAYSIYKIHDK